MKPHYLFAMMCALPLLAQAEIYKYVDKDGHVTYSGEPIKGGRKLILGPLPTMAPLAKPHTPASFPKVDTAKQKERDEMRRKILQDELDAEEKLLAETKQNLNNATPEVYRGADGKTYRNVARYDEKIKRLNADIELHEKNIAALKTELSRIK